MKSVWSASIDEILTIKKSPRLKGHQETDALIIGGGLTGVLTAYRLREAGVNCIIAEAKTLGAGTTQNTTAKITAQHGLAYHKIAACYGLETARQYYQANSRAIEDYRLLSTRYLCDFAQKTAYVYTTGDRTGLESEAGTYQALGIPARIVETPSLPFPTKGALGMEDQAQINPLKLLFALADKLTVYENTFIQRVEGAKALASTGSITAKYIILATNYPLINIPGLYFLKLYQRRGYVIALENAPDVKGMYRDEKENGFSFRNYQNLLLLGGGAHKTGKTGGCYGELRALAKAAYPGAAEKFCYAAQDCLSLDGIPYVGRHRAGKPDLFVATGFNKWGMTGAMAAAGVIRDLLVTGKSEYEDLFSPRRSPFTKQLAVNIGTAAAGLLSLGRPRCSHMGCKLKWNKAEKTWDCSCHGSRFDKQGEVLDNPAKRGINF